MRSPVQGLSAHLASIAAWAKQSADVVGIRAPVERLRSLGSTVSPALDRASYNARQLFGLLKSGATHFRNRMSEHLDDRRHPDLGWVALNLQYKKVYLTSADVLGRIPVWSRQRILRHGRASQIAEQLQKRPWLPGVITLFEVIGDTERRLYVIDGQHRVEALQLSMAQNHWDRRSKNVLVDVFAVKAEPDIRALYSDINRAEPLQLIDSLETLDDKEAKHRKHMVNGVAELLAAGYPNMFRSSHRCRKPHVNVDRLRNDLFESRLSTGMSSIDDLMLALKRINMKLGARTDQAWDQCLGPMTPTLNNALAKARVNQFYLGLDRTWLQ